MSTNYHLLLLLLVAVTMGHVIEGVAGISLDHIVGGSFGWKLPPNHTFYEEWARGQTFVVGDKLVFMYTPALQNVLEVSKKDFDACTQEEVVGMYYAGPTVLEIKKPGPHYYYCGVGVHCEGGQKLSIDVSATPVADPARDGTVANVTVGEGSVKDAKSAAGGVRPAVGLIAGLLLPLSVALLV